MRELKLKCKNEGVCGNGGRTPPGVRELKPLTHPPTASCSTCRTPPGVRELKPNSWIKLLLVPSSRTPPGVRELKLVGEEAEGVD